jgi:PIN domain nuclease of toxin-antitoxin system
MITWPRIASIRQCILKALAELKQSILQKARFAQLSIITAHALRAGLLPIQHRDPFERMIMAQKDLEQIHVITYDPAFKTGLIEVIPE